MLRFGLISAYPREDWHSRRLIDACASRGRVDVFAPTDFGIRTGSARARGRDAREWDVWLLARALGDDGDQDFQCGAYRALDETGLVVVNPVGALLDAEDKVRTSWLLTRAGIPTPGFVAVQSWDQAVDALEGTTGALVAKPPYGSLGVGVELVRRGDADAEARLRSMLSRYGVLYLQEFVPPRGRRRCARDLRLFVIGPRVAAAIERIARPGDWRANLHQGGRARAHRPGRHEQRIAVAATRALGLEYAGVDLIETDDGAAVIEVNGTPRWRGLDEATGRDTAEEIVDYAASVAEAANTGPSGPRNNPPASERRRQGGVLGARRSRATWSPATERASG